MLHSNQQYESYYGIGLLDDMHNYFPDLLYNIGRFRDVQDVLTYIRSTTQYRFDRFTIAEQARRPWQTQTQTQTQQQPQTQTQQQPQRYNHRRWRQRQTQAPRQTQAHRSDNYRTRLPTLNTPLTQPTTAYFPPYQLPPLTTFTDTPGLTHNRTNIPTLPYTTFDFTLPYTTMTTMPTIPTTDMDNATALLTLIGLFAPPTPTPTQLLEPVIVAPSRNVINIATTTETITEEPVPSGICVICQENFAISNTIRTIEHCSHSFHNSCILRHFETSVRCPTCRFDIRDSE
jgi:hypothetical protein